MTQSDLERKLQQLRSLPGETEIVEFKEAKAGYDFTKLGRYFSALSNEANLKGVREAWLVFGVADRGKVVVGTQYRLSRPDLDHLKGDIANKTTERITFTEIYELALPEGRVLLFQIPAAPRGIPVAFEGHYYGRDGEELGPLNIEEIGRIRTGVVGEDWSAGLCPDARLEDLDPKALEVAKTNFRSKNPHLAQEMADWDDLTFLNKAKLGIRGQLTRTAILLLGRPEAEYLISPAVARISWILKDRNGMERDYAHFGCPFLLAVDSLYAKLRNLKYRYIKGETLFPEEVDQYEPYTIREALNNCIAHQDYLAGGKINVVERDDELVFANLGSFLPGSVEEVIRADSPPALYRNQFLVQAMVNLKMIDTIGSGIKRMFQYQRERLFPMPDYETSATSVKLTITGKVLDLDYARVLVHNPDLSLEEIMLLDKVQKQKPIEESEVKWLKNRGLLEGRKPNYHISAVAVQPTADETLQAQYIHQKGFEDDHYRNLIVEYITKFPPASRHGINILLLNKLPGILSPEQKRIKINNLLAWLRAAGEIKNIGSAKKPKWVVSHRESVSNFKN
ncbi:MAG: ATP-binding protein [Saprospiraceae bacterium]